MQNETALTKIATEQNQNAQQLYSLTEPGLQSAESFYSSLATGDPGAIMRAIAPAAQQTTAAATGAKKNILANSPAGGEKNLALENVDVNRGASIGSTASQAYLNAPNALASLAGQGIGESISSAGTGISATEGGTSALSSLGGLQLQEQQVQAQQKGNVLGLAGSLGGDAATVGGAAEGGKSAGKAAAGLLAA